MVLPMVAVVMIYVTVHQTTTDHAPAWRAFLLALAVGAAVGLILVRLVPVVGGKLPKFAPLRAALTVIPIIALFAVIVIGPRHDRIYRGG